MTAAPPPSSGTPPSSPKAGGPNQDAPSNEPSTSGSLRTTASKGMAFMAAENIGSRIVLFASQIVLAYLLLPEHFGLSAIALTITTLAQSFVTFGLDDVLLQRGSSIPKWERTAFVISFTMTATVCAIVSLAAPLMGALFNEPDIAGLLWLAALSMVIQSLATVSMVKIRANLDFKWLAGLNALHSLLGQGLIILFAALGFGAFSFFLPLPIQQLIRTLLVWRRAPPKLLGKLSLRRIRIASSNAARVFGARVAEAVLTQADFFILGLFVMAEIVGFYAFAFRLSAVPVRILGMGLRSILVPTLTRIKGAADRQARASLEAAELLAFVVTPICFIQAAIAEPAMLLFFGEKWRGSIIIMQILSLGLAAEAILQIARACMTALGQFQRAMNYAIMSAIAFVIFLSVGSGLGLHFSDARGASIGAAIAVCAYTMTVTPIIFFRVFPAPGAYLRQFTRIFLSPIVISALAAAIGLYAARFAAPTFGDMFEAVILWGGGVWPVLNNLAPSADYLGEIFVIGAVASVTYVGLIRFASRRVFDQMLGLVRTVSARAVKR